MKKNKMYACCLAITLITLGKKDKPALDFSHQSSFSVLLHTFSLTGAFWVIGFKKAEGC